MGFADFDGAGAVRGPDGEVCTVGEGNCTVGTDEVAGPADVLGAGPWPAVLAPPLAHPATDAAVSVSATPATRHDFDFRNDRVDIIITACGPARTNDALAALRCFQSPRAQPDLTGPSVTSGGAVSHWQARHGGATV